MIRIEVIHLVLDTEPSLLPPEDVVFAGMIDGDSVPLTLVKDGNIVDPRIVVVDPPTTVVNPLITSVDPPTTLVKSSVTLVNIIVSVGCPTSLEGLVL